MGVPGSGRRKAPAALRLVEGRAPGRDSGGRLVDLPPPFELDEPEAPPYLTEYEAEVWARSIPQLVRLKLVKPEDFAALAAYCIAVGQLRESTIDIATRGLIHEVTKTGVRWIPRESPEWNEDDAAGQAHYEDDGKGRMGYFAPWPVVERKANPAVAVRNAAMTQIKNLGGLFGFSPAGMNALAGLDKGGAGRGGDDGPNPFEHAG